MEQEIHIAGIVVSVWPELQQSVRSCLEQAPGIEVHAEAAGKLVATLEIAGTKRAAEVMDAIRELPGVVDVALVYQHAEPASALEQEVQ
jgi:nitrate reductase NapD